MKLRRVDLQKKCKKKDAHKKTGLDKLKIADISYGWEMSAADALKVDTLS